MKCYEESNNFGINTKKLAGEIPILEKISEKSQRYDRKRISLLQIAVSHNMKSMHRYPKVRRKQIYLI